MEETSAGKSTPKLNSCQGNSVKISQERGLSVPGTVNDSWTPRVSWTPQAARMKREIVMQTALRSCLKSNAYRSKGPTTTTELQLDPSSAHHNSYQLRRFALSLTLFKQALRNGRASRPRVRLRFMCATAPLPQRTPQRTGSMIVNSFDCRRRHLPATWWQLNSRGIGRCGVA